MNEKQHRVLLVTILLRTQLVWVFARRVGYIFIDIIFVFLVGISPWFRHGWAGDAGV
jgi:hypothetical protein